MLIYVRTRRLKKEFVKLVCEGYFTAQKYRLFITVIFSKKHMSK